MENYKVKVGSEAESKEVQDFLKESGYKRPYANFVLHNGWVCINDKKQIMCVCESQAGSEIDIYEEIKFNELRDMVVLKRNDVNDKNVKDGTIRDLYQASNGTVFFYHHHKKKWIESEINKSASYMADVKPITKEPAMKEFLVKSQDGKWRLETEVVGDPGDDIIEVPEVANSATCGTYGDITFFNDFYFPDGRFKSGVIIWQRHTPPEALPFIDDEPKYDPEDIGIAKGYDLDELAKEYKFRDRYDGEADENYRAMLEQYISKETLNDKVASAEVARQEFIGDQPTAFDTQISGDHYKLLPIQPMKFALANGLDYAQGNVIKYVIRHASKGGKDDLLKAIHNIELMIEHYYG